MKLVKTKESIQKTKLLYLTTKKIIKKECYSSLNVKNITDNKAFWKALDLFLEIYQIRYHTLRKNNPN